MIDLPEVMQINGFGYAVASRSVPGAYRIVQDKSCTCPAGEFGAKTCRHRKAVAAYCAEKNRRLARPVAPPNIGALCD